MPVKICGSLRDVVGTLASLGYDTVVARELLIDGAVAVAIRVTDKHGDEQPQVFRCHGSECCIPVDIEKRIKLLREMYETIYTYYDEGEDTDDLDEDEWDEAGYDD